MKNKDYLFSSIANLIANESHCISVKVGCVIVLGERIISIGYNGTPSGYINCDQFFDSQARHFIKSDELRAIHHEWSNIHEIHAEMNAIMFAAKTGISIDGATLYTSIFPCQHCLKNIIQSGIKRIVYNNVYDLGEYDEHFMNYVKTVLILDQLKFARLPIKSQEYSNG